MDKEIKVGIKMYEFNGPEYTVKIAVDNRKRIQRVFWIFNQSKNSYRTKGVTWFYHKESVANAYTFNSGSSLYGEDYLRVSEIKWDSQSILYIKDIKEDNYRILKWKSANRLTHPHTHYNDFGDGTYSIPIWRMPGGDPPHIDLVIDTDYVHAKLMYLGQEIEFDMPKPRKVSNKIIMDFLYKLFYYLPYTNNVLVYEGRI